MEAHGGPLIRSRSNPLVRRLRRRIRASAEEGLCVVEGVRLLEEALATGLLPETVVVSPTLESHDRGRRLSAKLRDDGVPLQPLHDDALGSLADVSTSQGVLALLPRPTFRPDALLTDDALVVIAVGVQNPGNLGAIIRAAEAAGASGAFVTEGCADPFSPRCLRGAMGSAFRLPLVAGVTPREAIGQAKDRDVTVAACVPSGGLSQESAPLREPVALLLGGEGSGLPDHVIGESQLRITIPMATTVESLNVSVAAGILLFEAARQRRGVEARR